jgi:uncharacterized membrane protein YidH (DUF202 family)
MVADQAHPTHRGGAPLRRHHNFEVDRALLEADRTTMQTLQTSLSLIAFGFSITTFFFDAVGKGLRAAPELGARRLGLVLVILGVVFLATGLIAQFPYRQGLLRRLVGADERRPDIFSVFMTPPIITAAMLLVIGIVVLIGMLLRRMAG